jgi:hypothetical protein
MRFLRILALSAGGFVIGNCADDGGGGKVNQDISWYVGCAEGNCGSSRAYHNTMISPKKKFHVTCHKVGNTIEFQITDPGSDEDPATPQSELHPGSSIEIRNGDTSRMACDVTVRDYASRDAASPLIYTGKCQGSATDGGCTLTGGFNQQGWTWAGQLACPKLNLNNGPQGAVFNLFSAEGMGVPVKIAVDNCD